MTLRAGLILAAVVAFALLSGAWEAARQRLRADSAVVQEKVTGQTGQSSDRTATAVRVIIEKGQKEIEYVETLPGADTRLDPVRRAGKCAALARVLEHPVCTDDQADGEPEGAVPNGLGAGEAQDPG